MQESLTDGSEDENYKESPNQEIGYLEGIGIVSGYCDGCKQERGCEINRGLRAALGRRQTFQNNQLKRMIRVQAEVEEGLYERVKGELEADLPEILIVCELFATKGESPGALGTRHI